MKRALIGLAAGSLPALLLPLVIASCARTEDGEPAGSSPTLPEAPEDASAPDDGCDPADPACVGEAIPCSDVSWCPTETNVESIYALTKVWGASPSDVWAVGAGATVIHWDGAAWTRTPVPPALPNPLEVRNTFFSVWGSGPDDVWIASTTSTIYRNTGSGWVHQKPPFEDGQERPVRALWGDGPGRIRVGADAFVYQEVRDGVEEYLIGNQLTASTAGELRWQPEEGTPAVLGYYGAPDDLWLVGDNQFFHEWQRAFVQNRRPLADGGFAWTQSEVHSLATLHAIWGSSADDIWAVGDQGAMRRLRAGRAGWEVVPPVTSEALRAIWGTSATNIWAVGDNGTILHFDGVAWTPSPAAFPVGKKRPRLTGIWGSGPDDVWIVGGHVALRFTGEKGAGR